MTHHEGDLHNLVMCSEISVSVFSRGFYYWRKRWWESNGHSEQKEDNSAGTLFYYWPGSFALAIRCVWKSQFSPNSQIRAAYHYGKKNSVYRHRCYKNDTFREVLAVISERMGQFDGYIPSEWLPGRQRECEPRKLATFNRRRDVAPGTTLFVSWRVNFSK